MATSGVTVTSAKKKYKYFDLANFEEKVIEKEVPFSPAVTLEEAMNRVENKTETVLKAINAYLQKQVLKEAKKEVAALGPRKALVLSAVRVFRSMPPFDRIEDRKEQTKKLLEMLRQNTLMCESIRAQALREAESEDEPEEEPEEE